MMTFCIIVVLFGLGSSYSLFSEYHEDMLPQVGAVLTNKNLAFDSLTDAYAALRNNLNLETSNSSKENCVEWSEIGESLKIVKKKMFRDTEDIIPSHFKISPLQTQASKNTYRQTRGIISWVLGI